jgi:hypothetical protein
MTGMTGTELNLSYRAENSVLRLLTPGFDAQDHLDKQSQNHSLMYTISAMVHFGFTIGYPESKSIAPEKNDGPHNINGTENTFSQRVEHSILRLLNRNYASKTPEEIKDLHTTFLKTLLAMEEVGFSIIYPSPKNIPNLYVVYSANESATQDDAGFWSPEGWTDVALDATLFDGEDIQTMNLPMSLGQDAHWILLADFAE